MKPIFLFSLPRSGSTFLQRILAAHGSISTLSEPWILIPLFYSLRHHGIYAEYGHVLLSEAIEDFCSELPNGQKDYRAEVEQFVLHLYEKHCSNQEEYFLDKTPEYHLIVNEIIETFPTARFIFLWRDPLSVISSLMIPNIHSLFEARPRWSVAYFKVHLFDGIENLISAYLMHSGKSLSVQYERIVKNPDEELARICEYLELDYTPEMKMKFENVELKGRRGDKVGMTSYKTITAEPLDKWKYVINNPFRKWWCKRYLLWLGRDRLAVMGYDLDNLLKDLQSVPLRANYLGDDICLYIYGFIQSMIDLRPIKYKIKKRSNFRYIHPNF